MGGAVPDYKDYLDGYKDQGLTASGVLQFQGLGFHRAYCTWWNPVTLSLSTYSSQHILFSASTTT